MLIERRVERLGLEQQTWLAEVQQGVVDRVVLRPEAILVADLAKLVGAPTQGGEYRFDEDGLGILLAEVFAEVANLLDASPRRGESRAEGCMSGCRHIATLPVSSLPAASLCSSAL